MKKLLSIILVFSFILCASALFAVSAAETALNGSGKGWTAARGKNSIKTDSDRDIEFYWKSGSDGKTYDWVVSRDGAMQEGTITATVSAAGNVGIYFGASGVKENVEDNVANLTGAANVRYSWIVLEIDPTTKNAKLRFYYDDDIDGGVALNDNSQSNIPLNDTTDNAAKYGIDGESDVELKVEFTKAGKMIAYVNGVKTIIRNEGFPTFGTEYGMIIRGASYGSEKASSEGRLRQELF